MDVLISELKCSNPQCMGSNIIDSNNRGPTDGFQPPIDSMSQIFYCGRCKLKI